ncbi:hypothetical protein CGJ28_26920, partial [Vibrio parahaemolyticus]
PCNILFRNNIPITFGILTLEGKVIPISLVNMMMELMRFRKVFLQCISCHIWNDVENITLIKLYAFNR